MKRTRRPDAPLSAIPNHLLDRRSAVNLKQSEVAEELGTKRGTYAILEAGYSLPSRDMADRLCKVFGCELADLFSEEVIRLIR